MIKIIYPDGKVDYRDVRRLTNYDLYLILGSWATMRYLYTSQTPSGKLVDFYIVYQGGLEDGCRLPINQKVLNEYGVCVRGTAIICKADILDSEE